MKKVKVSIIIPVYNAGEHLKFCMDSVINQSYSNIEIIAVNDGSKDNSLEILNEYQNKYPKLIKVIDKKNSGVASSRNEGLKNATGEYLTFIDNDDYITKDCIESYVNSIKDNDILVSGYVRMSYSNKILFKRKLSEGILTPYVQLASWGKLYRTSFIKNNNIVFLDSKIADDFYFNVKAYNLTNKIRINNQMNYYWMYNDNSLSNTDSKKLNRVNDLLNVLKIIDKDVSFKNNSVKEYFYFRSIVYYLLFSSKGCRYDKVIDAYNVLFNWLKEINCNYNNNRYLKIFSKLNGEQLKVKLVLIIFNILQKIKLDKLFLKLYSR